MNKKQLERMAKKAEKEEKKEQANVRKVREKEKEERALRELVNLSIHQKSVSRTFRCIHWPSSERSEMNIAKSKIRWVLKQVASSIDKASFGVSSTAQDIYMYIADKCNKEAKPQRSCPNSTTDFVCVCARVYACVCPVGCDRAEGTRVLVCISACVALSAWDHERMRVFCL